MFVTSLTGESCPHLPDAGVARGRAQALEDARQPSVAPEVSRPRQLLRPDQRARCARPRRDSAACCARARRSSATCACSGASTISRSGTKSGSLQKLQREPWTDDDGLRLSEHGIWSAWLSASVDDTEPELNWLHEPVMVAEVLEHLAPSRGGVFVDCTVGLGGHARALLEAGASRLIGLDRDPAALAARARGAGGVRRVAIELVHGDYRGFDASARRARGRRVSTACWPISACRRCSSTRRDAASASGGTSRSTCGWIRRAGPRRPRLLAAVDEQTLADVIYEFGEERHARRVARAIVEARKRAAESRRRGSWRTSCGGRFRARATRESIRRRGRFRRSASGSTASSRGWMRFSARVAGGSQPGGRLVVITFHSLEDRIVKHTLRALQAAGAIERFARSARSCRREAEVDRNPRARSAKLRAADDGRQAVGHDRRNLRIRDQERRPQQPDRPRGRSRAPSRDVALGRRSASSSSSVLLFSAWQHFELLRHGYRLEQMQQERAAEDEINRHLRLEIETLRSPARIERLATGRLTWWRRSAEMRR